MSSPSQETSPTPSPNTPSVIFPAVAAMFIGSGASGLMYEVLWTRWLTNFFGASLYAVATVLTCFMGGLALGSWLLGRRAERFRRPLFVYGVLEVVIAVVALAFPFLLRAAEPIVGMLYATGSDANFATFTAVRFIIVFLLLIVPTTMMGATLPVLARAFVNESGRVGRSVGGLYALNTVGACVGVFLAGFVIIERFGLTGTLHIAAAVNFIVGGLAMAVGSRHFIVEPGPIAPREQIAAADRVPLTPSTRRLVFLAYGLSGFASLALQVCWFRALIFSFDKLKNTTYSFSGMLLVFLVGLALGSALMQQFADRQKRLLRLFGLLQLGIGISAGLSLFVIQIAGVPFNDVSGDALIWHAAVGNVLAKTFAAIGLPTLLMGMAFPVVSVLVVRGESGVSGDVGRLFAANTLGAIVGSFCAGFVLVPLMGIAATIALLSTVYMVAGITLIATDPEAAPADRTRLAIAAAAAAAIVSGRTFFEAKGQPFQQLQFDERSVFYTEGPTATVSVVESKDGERMIFVDDVGVAGTDKIMQTDQKTLAHVPMALLGGRADAILTVGFGAGGASWSYTLYPEVANIHAIEISREVLTAAPVLTAANHGIVYPSSMVEEARAKGAQFFKGARNPVSAYTHHAAPGFLTFDPRYRVLIDDARSYLRFTETRYDVIATDCTDLRYKSNANLYDLEYFTLCREALSDRGLVVVWMPLAGLHDKAYRSALRTFQEVFPQMTVWFFPNQPTHYVLLIGAKGRLNIDYAEVTKALSLPAIQADLDEIGLRDPDKLISCFVNDERTMKAHLADAPLNTESHPYIEFASPRYGYSSAPLRDNMRAHYKVQSPVWDLVTNAPESARDRIARMQQANAVAFEGHVYFREFNFTEACRKYMEAAAIAPDDTSLRRLLDFADLRQLIDRNRQRPDPNVLWLAHSVGSAYLMQGRHADVVNVIDELADTLPDPPRSGAEDSLRRIGVALNTLMARAYILSGRPQNGRRYFERARTYDPGISASYDEFVRGAAPATP